MQWPICVALLIFVAWSYPAQAVRISALEIQQRWPEKQTKISSRNYPIEYVLLPNPKGGYRRRYVHGLGKAAPTTTTERPLVRVWNSFVRSVQPAFSFRNLTNPLANFFNDGSANIIETSPVLIQSYEDDQELPYEESAPVASQSSSKRKRKRRKQLKRRPVYDSDESEDPYGPYEPYYAPPPHPAHTQPMFFYDTNSGSYYGVQRFSPQDFQSSFYHYPNQQHGEAEQGEIEQEKPAVMRRLGNRKVTLLRPLPVSAPKAPSPAKLTEFSEPGTTNESDDTIEDTENDSDDSSASGDSTIGEEENNMATHSPLSESMRNALGAYMRDDRHSRQRQRQTSEGAGAFDAEAKVSPRSHPRRFFRLGAW
ncbi:uncharacterized protein LOC110177209 [Drosophila serrata]|uniref:uncharacterized protein LOC110177209 n=1 Tax=Drosophila serrata TaxID=7274 RepID=UPI000A1D2186|nr:uncharacterized protein LOC110177209 [Drosophila serrata]